MEEMKWNESFSVGVKQFDDEHKRIIEYINELNNGIVKGESLTSMTNVLGGLIDYTVNHFAHEETLLREKGYPGLPGHKDEHDDLFMKVNEYRTRLAQEKNTLAPELAEFLKKWLTDHILTIDKAYGAFLNSKGVT